MKPILIVVALSASLLVGALDLVAGGKRPSLPSPTGHVNDFAGLVSSRAEEAMSAIAEDVKVRTGAEIAVVTIRTTGGEEIEPYAVRLFMEWGIGERGKDNGVLVLVAVDDRKMWIKPGYGLEGAVPDAEAHRVYREVLVPGFRAGKYDQALVTAVSMLAADIFKEQGQTYAYGDSLPRDLVLATGARRGEPGEQVSPLRMLLGLGVVLFVVAVVVVAFAARFGYKRGGRWGGGFWTGGFGNTGGGFGGGFGGFGGGSCGGAGAGGGW
ncbi:MAG: TPM domain-containing protein [bacterium]